MSDSTSVVDEQIATASGLRLAGTAARYGAACVDEFVAVMLVLIVAGVASERLPPRAGTAVHATLGIAFFALYFLYYFLFEGALTATPGKLFFSLRIRNLDSTRPGWRAAGLRTLARILEVNPLLLGCLPAVILIWKTPNRQRWGDILAGTVVVSTARRR